MNTAWNVHTSTQRWIVTETVGLLMIFKTSSCFLLHSLSYPLPLPGLPNSISIFSWKIKPGFHYIPVSVWSSPDQWHQMHPDSQTPLDTLHSLNSNLLKFHISAFVFCSWNLLWLPASLYLILNELWRALDSSKKNNLLFRDAPCVQNTFIRSTRTAYHFSIPSPGLMSTYLHWWMNFLEQSLYHLCTRPVVF